MYLTLSTFFETALAPNFVGDLDENHVRNTYFADSTQSL